LTDVVTSTASFFGKDLQSPLGSFGNVVRQIKSVLNYSSPNFYTTWIEDTLTPVGFKFGYGTGAIECTSFTSLSTSCVLKGTGIFSAQFEDPYELMTITTSDIEKAISDVINPNNFAVMQVAQDTYQQLVDANMQNLNLLRESRGASRIVFNTSPNTIYGNNLTAIIEKTGEEIPFEALTFGVPFLDGVKVSKEYLLGGEVLGEQGLSDKKAESKVLGSLRNSSLSSTELSLFKETVQSIYDKINFDKNSSYQYNFGNSSTSKEARQVDYIRRKLTFYFAGKNIIQPMDTVNVFIGSKAKFDTKIMSGMKNAFTGFGLFKNFSNQLTKLSSSWSAVFSPSNIENQMEKSVFGAESIPDYMWSVLRRNYTSENQGCHVYAGIIDSVTSTYRDGTFSVSISGKDNTEYLNQSFVNFKPGANVNAGVFYEPLTPFKTSFDSVYNLRGKLDFLDENKEFIAGKPKSSGGVLQGRSFGDSELPSEVVYTKTGIHSNGKKVIYAPDGLVYKWKEGIGTYSQKGSSDNIAAEENVGAFSTASTILASQDIMNAVSIMITGTPYNYYNYYKAGIEAGSLAKSSNPGESPSLTTSALSNFIEKIIKNNALWGDFIPFKGISISKSNMIEKMSLKSQSIIDVQSGLSEEYKKFEDLKTKITIASTDVSSVSGVQLNPDFEGAIQGSLKVISESISRQEENMLKLMDDTNFSIIGDDIYEDYDFYFNNGSSYENSEARKQARNKTNFLTRRLSWTVRSNVDKNYFIVDESYDKNFDILAFEKDISGQKQNIFNNEYTQVLEKVRTAVDLLGMEFFADTQGNLRVRSPQYNRIPSSVFLTMIKNRYTKKTGSVFPQFLTNLFFDQINKLSESLNAIENTIRYLCIILELDSDSAAEKYIKSSSGVTSPNKKEFCFLTTEDGVPFGISAITNPKEDETEDERRKRFVQLKEISNGKLKEQLSISNTFDIASRIKRVREDIEKTSASLKENTDIKGYKDYLTNKKEKLESLSIKIYKITGEKLKITDWVTYLSVEDGSFMFGGVVFPQKYKAKNFEIDQKISRCLSDRQKIIKQLYYSVKNCYEFNSLNEEETAVKLLNPTLASPKNENPEIFDYLIEDETYDDYGPGSGSRFIIRNSQIIGYNINENNPEFTAVSVTGRISKDIPKGSYNLDFPELPSNGNSQIASDAIDYDMWRMYGLKQKFQIDKPFLTNPSTQTEPYAVSLLMNQRKNLIRGSITIVGNEYMQPGEVVYIEQKGMLFYVEDVRHSLSYGNNFQTTLTLSYGHYPGEYIPTQLDIAGKVLYTGRDTYDVQVVRELPTASGDPVGSIVMVDQNYLNNFTAQNEFSMKNADAITNIANKLQSEIIKQSSSGKKVILNMFIYEDKQYGAENKTAAFAEEIKKILLGKSSYAILDPRLVKRFTENNFQYKTTDGQVKSTIRLINLSDPNSSHNPSSFAYHATSALLDKKSTFFLTSDPIPQTLSNTSQGKVTAKRMYLTRYIVDCFVKSYFE